MSNTHPTRTSAPRTLVRLLLAGFLVFAGISHLSFGRKEFRNQVPTRVPMDVDGVVVASGVVEVGLGGALLVLPKERARIGWILATFFTAIFPGNIAQYTEKRDGFGLDTDRKRLVRLFFQPVLVFLAIWSTRAD